VSKTALVKGFDDTMNANSMNDTMKIRISQLPLGVHEYHFTSTPVKLGLENNFSSPVEIDVNIDKTPRQLFLRVSVTTSGTFQCDRCIEEFSLPLKNQYSVFYVYEAIDSGKDQADEVRVITADTVYIDLTKDVSEIALLAVPLKLLCTEECKGLCPRCGTNWNRSACNCKEEWVDSRWQGLEGLNIE
jgi:uncharacterized protein